MNEIVQALEQMEKRIIGHIDDRIHELRVELRTELQEQVGGLRTEMHEQISGMHTQITVLQTQVGGLQAQVHDLRGEMNQRFDELEERQTEIPALHTEKQARRIDVLRLDFEALTKRVEKQELITKHLL